MKPTKHYEEGEGKGVYRNIMEGVNFLQITNIY
jgi:hypothetical protein